ncbi:uncharacterized protein LOC134286794 [Aedes albopictus]|uniref:Integrase catalytic domain-containing protein n=1 Tax=Aedes albopictus TaxID=7160 RepID=A0ABM1Y4U6_AEDAL
MLLERSPAMQITGEVGPTANQIAARQVWPKKLPNFSGEPEEWPIFYSSYEGANAACGFSDVENIIRLRECLRGPAREAVISKLMFPKSVPSIIETLRRLYGRPELMVKNLLGKVRRLEAPKPERLDTLINFGMTVQQLSDHLIAADLQSHLANPTLMEELVDKLPAAYKLEWVRFKRAYAVPTLKEFAMFMDVLVADASEVTVLSQPKMDKTRHEKEKHSQKGHVYAHNDDDVDRLPSSREPCPICNGLDHRVRNCEKFQRISLESRLAAVERFKLCEVCLFNHGSRCRSRIRCNIGNCRERHNPLLHQAGTRTAAASRTVNAECNTHGPVTRSVLFKVIPVTLHNKGRSVDTFAFVDEGSSRTLVESSLARYLELTGETVPLKLIWTSNVSRTEKFSKVVDIVISARGQKERFNLKGVHTVSGLNLPKQSLWMENLIERFDHRRDLPAHSYIDAEPRILIGLRNLDLLTPLETRVGRPGEPVAVRSTLGWAVYGPCGPDSNGNDFVGVHDCSCKTDEDLNELIRQQFILEEAVVCVSPLPESADDKRARQILEQTTRRVGDRYETGLLWKTNDVRFPNSWYMAVKRLKSLEAKLARDPELRANVHQQIRDYVEKRYAHKASEQELASADPDRVWYLPINVVTNPRKPAKKRLVWDAAAQVEGVSLNSQLLKGPDLLNSLPSVICVFRERPIAFGGDVREMFHQVQIIPADKHSQRFIFRFDPAQPPQIYIMDVATFGATCSPCSVQHVMRENALECSSEFPEAAAAIIDKTYMDDYVDSANTIEEAITRSTQVREVHARAGFEMRNWVSNSRDVLHALGEAKIQEPVVIGGDTQDNWERVLGLIWNPEGDFLSFSTRFHGDLDPYVFEGRRPTKRIVARCVMSLFDPTGMLSPFSIHGKMLIQDLWRSGTMWDQDIPDEEYEKWRRWVQLLVGIKQLRIPRPYFGSAVPNQFHSLQLHVFSDASELAMGCAAYFRAVDDRGVHVALVMAKSKVAPLQHQSIPRLELQAAVMGARMLKNVMESHTLTISRSFLWTDSSTVLSWIRSDNRKYKQYAAHRVGEILSHTQLTDWRWVPTKENVADCLTKWGKHSEPNSDGIWLNGPTFLYGTEETWPQQRQIASDVPEELRPCYLLHHIAIPQKLIKAENISKWNVLLRTMAMVGRFINNCRLRIRGQPIETIKATSHQLKCLKRSIPAVIVPLQQNEYKRAEINLWRFAQADSFPDEVKVLLKNRDTSPEALVSIERTSPLYKLSPFADEFGVVRIEGRTANAGYAPFDSRFPIILPKDHLVTFRLLDHYHCRYGHANKETIVNEVRQRFFIPNLRSVVDKVMKACQRCKISKCKPQSPRMAPLPEQRLTPYVRPFCYVGVDYLGPLEVTVGRRKEKRYVVVFTCLVVRAVHLEIAYDLSSDSCVMAIRRFVRRRGSPVQIFSDNGTNFVGANRHLMQQIREINDRCANTFTDAKTKWSFNPPASPHMGGVWERMVRSVKETMRALDDGRKLNDEILVTVLAETEWFINSRPFTYMPQECGNDEALTPNHFIFGNTSGSHEPIRSCTDLAEALRSSYQRSQYLSDALWKRWIKEYFPTVNRRSKWFEDVRPVQVGDLVYVADGDRRSWIRGKVEEVIQGRDGRVRQAIIRTVNGNGKLKRPVVKLAVIEVGDGEPGNTPKTPHPDPRGGGCSGITGSRTGSELADTKKLAVNA